MNTIIKNPKTNSKEVKEAIQNYIIESIDTSDYLDGDNPGLKTQLEFICSEFKRVACFDNNIRFHKTYQAAFIDWFQGMPSYFNIEVYQKEILELMASFGLPLPANKKEYEGVQLFNTLIYMNFIDLCKKNTVNFYSYL